jgi:hypothetical protein
MILGFARDVGRSEPAYGPSGTRLDVWPPDGVFSGVLSEHFPTVGLEGIDKGKILATSGLHHSGGALKRTG